MMLKRSLGQLRSNPLRTMLTLLGVVFGVGAVVAMMSIGEGAQRQILARIEAMGATSVHINARPVTDSELPSIIQDTVGLSREDVRAIERAIPTIKRSAYRSRHTLGVTDLPLPAHEVAVLGVSAHLLETHALHIGRGRPLDALAHQRGLRVAVIGHELSRAAFPNGDAVGKVIRLDYSYFEVVGVLAAPSADATGRGGDLDSALGAGDESGDGEQKKATRKGGKKEAVEDGFGGGFDAQIYANAVLIPFETLTSELMPEQVYHELDMISVQVNTTDETLEVKRKLDRVLEHLHGGHHDFDIVAPEEILRQKQATQAIFNAVLLAIAAISLIVGGIGVMNIMLANIMERVSEIGLRRAIGARKRDIRNQFLLEAVSICSVGGVLGIVMGLGASWVVSVTSDLPMAIAWESTALSFGISLLVGVTFGLMPAVRAANIDPIDALRGD